MHLAFRLALFFVFWQQQYHESKFEWRVIPCACVPWITCICSLLFHIYQFKKYFFFNLGSTQIPEMKIFKNKTSSLSSPQDTKMWHLYCKEEEPINLWYFSNKIVTLIYTHVEFRFIFCYRTKQYMFVLATS